MKVENLETAERFAKKRRELQEIYDILVSYCTIADITVEAKYLPDKLKAGCIRHNETFNALMAKLVESEIKQIDEFVKQL